MTVVTTAPTYLFWRCAPPELRVPRAASAKRVRGVGGAPGRGRAARLDHAARGAAQARRRRRRHGRVRGDPAAPRRASPGTTVRRSRSRRPPTLRGQRRPAGRRASSICRPLVLAGRLDRPPPPSPSSLRRRARRPGRRGRGLARLPLSLHFCAKENFRDNYRRRPLPVLLEEIDRLIAQGVEYVYFIDEIFLPNAAAAGGAGRARRRVRRPDPDRPVEAGDAGAARARRLRLDRGRRREHDRPRAAPTLDKDCRMSTDELADRLIIAKRHVPFVQANLIEVRHRRRPACVDAWRERLREQGVWANEPVPLFPYPGSPDYRSSGAPPDDQRLGAGARPLPAQLRRLQRHPGRAAAAARRNWSAAARCR